MVYLIAIDETGKFAPGIQSSVGGYVACGGALSRTQMDTTITTWIQNTNKNHNVNLQCPGDLHYSELSAGKYKSTGENFGYEIGIKIIKEFCQSLRDIGIIRPFRSLNSTGVHVHEQHEYFLHLETVLMGVAKELEFGNGDQLIISIAGRKHENFMGSWGYANQNEYEKGLCRYFAERLQIVCGLPETALDIQILTAGKCIHLQAADIVISSGVKGQFQKLQNNVGIFDVRHHSRITEIEEERNFPKDGAPATAEEASEYLGWIASLKVGTLRHQKAIDGLKHLLLALDDNSQKVLAMLIRHDFERAVSVRGYDSAHLTLCCQRTLALCPFVEMLGKDLQYEILWEKVQLVSHAVWPSANAQSAAPEFVSFVNDHAKNLFQSPIREMLERAKHTTILVQDEHFNKMEFENVANYCKGPLENYKKLLSAALSLPGMQDRPDELYARLCGTLGQAHGFFAFKKGISKEERTEHLAKAKSLLEDDLSNLSEGTAAWQQGNNYLVSLLACCGEYHEASQRHFWNFEGVNNFVGNPKDLPFRLDETARRLCHPNGRACWDNFILSNQLRIAAGLGARAMPATFACELVAVVEKQGKGYPQNLVAKWASYCLHLLGKEQDAIRLLDNTGLTGSDHSLVLLMDALNIALRCKLQFNGPLLEKAKDIIETCVVPGSAYRLYLQEAKWVNAVLDNNLNNVSYEEIMSGLPYYYG